MAIINFSFHGLREFTDYLHRVRTNTPVLADKDVYQYAKEVARELRKTGMFKDFSGELRKSFKANRKDTGKYNIEIPFYGYLLGSVPPAGMKAHWAPLANPKVRAWYEMHYPLERTHGAPGMKRGWMWVERSNSSFIDDAIEWVWFRRDTILGESLMKGWGEL